MDELFRPENNVFCRVLYDDPELCESVIKILAGNEIDDFEIDDDPGLKLYAYPYGPHLYIPCIGNTGRDYDVRITTATQYTAHLKHNYYDQMHQSMEYYMPDDDTPKSVVILVCDFDVGGDGQARHTLHRVCKNAPHVELHDAVEIYISVTPDVSTEDDALRRFIQYLLNGSPTDELTQRLNKALKTVREKANKR